jgi:alkyl sulfatase BDS1-like metallo-beta-lactamase superfamily hydrolase
MPADFADRTGFGNAERGLIARREPGVTLTFPQLLTLLTSGSPDGIQTTGDQGVLRTLLSLTDQPDPSFPIVTP